MRAIFIGFDVQRIIWERRVLSLQLSRIRGTLKMMVQDREHKISPRKPLSPLTLSKPQTKDRQDLQNQ